MTLIKTLLAIADAVSSRRQNVIVNSGPVDQNFTVNNNINSGISTTNDNTVNVQTLERCLSCRIDGVMNNIVDAIEDMIQNAILTAIDNIITPRIELTVRSINASSGRDAASLSAFSQRGEYTGITASFENIYERINIFHELYVNDETWGNIPDEVNELSVPRTHFDRQSHPHHGFSDFALKIGRRIDQLTWLQ